MARYNMLMNGVVLMLIASSFFSLMSAQVKALGPTFPFAEVVFFRSLFGAAMLVVLLRRARVPFAPQRWALLIVRGLLGAGAMLGYFFALQRAIFADIAVLTRLQPVLVASLSPLLLREGVPRSAVVALVLSFGGVLLVLQPGTSALSMTLPQIAALAAALLSALAHMVVRRLNATDHPLVIVMVFTWVTGLSGGLLALPSFVLPDARQWLLLLGVALCSTFAQWAMTTAYGRDRASVIAAATYSQVVYALSIGWLAWREWPSALSLFGAALITIAGGVLALSRGRREERASR